MSDKILNPKAKARPKVIVIDLGSYQSRADMSGNDTPHYFIPSLFGSRKTFDIKGHNIEFFVGTETRENADPQSIYNPFKNGIISDSADIEKLLRHIFNNEVQINPEKKSVIITTPINAPQQQKAKIAEILFERFKISSLYMSPPTTLGMYASTKFTGTVVDCGESFTQVSSIFDMTVIPQASNVSNVAGSLLNTQLQKTLKDVSYHFSGANGREVVRTFKEKYCFVANSPEQKKSSPIDFVLADGNTISVNEPGYKAPELLFAPEQFGYKANGISSMIVDSIMKSDIQLRPDLFSNIFLIGATTLMNGFTERVQKEVEELAKKENYDCPINVVAVPKRANAAWIGGSIVGGLSVFPQLAAHADEYEELGESLIFRRFF